MPQSGLWRKMARDRICDVAAKIGEAKFEADIARHVSGRPFSSVPPKADAYSRLGRQHNAIDFSFGGTNLRGRTNVGTAIRSCNVLNRFFGHPQPSAIHFHLIVVVDHTGLSRTTI